MIIDGKKLSEEILNKLVKGFVKQGRLRVAVVVVGQSPAAFSFIKQKEKAAEKIEIALETIKLANNASQKELEGALAKLSKDKQTAGIILQLPLPKKFSVKKAVLKIAKEKDIDNLRGDGLALSPAVAVIDYIFKKYKVNYLKKNVVLNGKGFLVGAPIYAWLKKQTPLETLFLTGQKANVKVIDRATAKQTRKKLLSQADIIISGVGKPGLIKPNEVKRGVMAIDFGFALQNGKIKGDFAEAVAKKAKLFTPTPGGTGPLLVALLFQNLYILSTIKQKYEKVF